MERDSYEQMELHFEWGGQNASYGPVFGQVKRLCARRWSLRGDRRWPEKTHKRPIDPQQNIELFFVTFFLNLKAFCLYSEKTKLHSRCFNTTLEKPKTPKFLETSLSLSLRKVYSSIYRNSLDATEQYLHKEFYWILDHCFGMLIFEFTFTVGNPERSKFESPFKSNDSFEFRISYHRFQEHFNQYPPKENVRSKGSGSIVVDVQSVLVNAHYWGPRWN